MAGAEALTHVVIADAGPLIALSRVGWLPLLRGLFGAVEITEQIRAEVLDGGAFPGQGDIAAALQAGWLRCHAIDLAPWQPRLAGVDDGEASAMLLAAMPPRSPADHGRPGWPRRSAPAWLCRHGVAAVVGLAKLQGLVPLAGPILAGMRANGYFIGNDVAASVLARVGELAAQR